MTRQEFYDKYGEVEVSFCHYFKYSFTYVGFMPDGTEVICTFGGDSDSIYRHEVSAGVKDTVMELQPYEGTAFKDGIAVDNFSDF